MQWTADGPTGTHAPQLVATGQRQEVAPTLRLSMAASHVQTRVKRHATSNPVQVRLVDSKEEWNSLSLACRHLIVVITLRM